MILTVCISPSVDVTIELDQLNIGKVNLVKSKTLSFTGKAINVAIGVSRLGAEAYATGFMYNENGVMFEQALDKEGVPFAFVWNGGRVRENYKFIDKRSMLTEINDIGEHVSTEKLVELLSMVRNLSSRADITVIAGSLPRGADASYYRDLFRAVNPHSLKIVDTEGMKLFSALEAEVDLAKPNLEELQETLGREFKDRDDMLSGCREILDRGAKTVLLSLGTTAAASMWRSTPRWARATAWSQRRPSRCRRGRIFPRSCARASRRARRPSPPSAPSPSPRRSTRRSTGICSWRSSDTRSCAAKRCGTTGASCFTAVCLCG